MNDASHVSNVTSKLFQFLIDTRCQVVNSYTFVAAASCYDITAYKEHHLSVTVVLIIHYYATQLSSYKITNAQLQFLAFCSPSTFCMLSADQALKVPQRNLRDCQRKTLRKKMPCALL